MKDVSRWQKGEPKEPGLYYLAQCDQGGHPFIGVYRCDKIFKSEADVFKFDHASEKNVREQFIEWYAVERTKIVWTAVHFASSLGGKPDEPSGFPWNASHWMRLEFPEYPDNSDE